MARGCCARGAARERLRARTPRGREGSGPRTSGPAPSGRPGSRPASRGRRWPAESSPAGAIYLSRRSRPAVPSRPELIAARTASPFSSSGGEPPDSWPRRGPNRWPGSRAGGGPASEGRWRSPAAWGGSGADTNVEARPARSAASPGPTCVAAAAATRAGARAEERRRGLAGPGGDNSRGRGTAGREPFRRV